MLTKKYAKNGKTCRVTFALPAEVGADTAFLCGAFTDWMSDAVPMKKGRDGTFKASVTLKTGDAYHFRYLLDGEYWENDWEADRYEPNEFGTEDSVVDLTENLEAE